MMNAGQIIKLFRKVGKYEGWIDDLNLPKGWWWGVVCNNFIPFLREYFEKVADDKHKKFVSFKQMMRKEEKVNETFHMTVYVSWTGFKSTKPLTG